MLTPRNILLLLYVLISTLMFGGSKTDSLEALLKTSIHDTVRLDIYNRLSFDYKNSDPEKSVEYALKAVALAEKGSNEKAVARAKHTAGTIYYIQANYPEALRYYLEALKIREQLHDSVNMAKGYNNIALIHFEMGNQLDALQYHMKSIAIKEKRKDQPGLASSYGNAGIIYYKLAQNAGYKKDYKGSDSLFNVALNYQRKALVIQEKLAADAPDNEVFQLGLAGTYNNIGNISFELAGLDHNNTLMYEEALAYHKKALQIQNMFDDVRGKSHSHINMAGVYEKLKQYDKAILDYSIALQLVTEMGLLEERKVIFEGLSMVYEKKGDYKKSLEYYKMFNEIKDSILNEQRTEQIAEMQEKYNAEKKEKEILILSKNKKIAETELEKEKVLKRSVTWGFVLAVVIVILIGAFLFILWNRYKLKTKISAQLEEQNVLIGMKNKEITDSIRYAKRIQESILPPDSQMKQLLPDSFIVYKPKDIVSGDFYWAEEWGGKIFVAVADCTGHGVPGAFMSIVGHNLLDQAVTVYGLDKPALILNHINKQLYKILHQNQEENSVKDGMDICLIAIDKKKNKLEFAGAFNSLWVIRNNELLELKADKLPVGAFFGDVDSKFTNVEFDLQSNDRLYLYSDGFADQFGGPHGKKFKYRQLKEQLLTSSSMPMQEQGVLLREVFENWKGNLDQIDDICVMGIRV
ncbi:MAG: hypothetical protein Fur0041_04730 [Bacteroidia bacterium]